MFNEERLDLHGRRLGVGNLPHVLTLTFKTSTFGVRGRVECSYYWCFNKVLVYFWLNLKGNRKEQLKVCWWILGCRVADCIWEELNITNVWDCNTGHPHKRYACLYVRNIKKCIGILKTLIEHRKLISSKVVKARNKRKPTLDVVYCRFRGSEWRIWAIWWVLRWLLLYFL